MNSWRKRWTLDAAGKTLFLLSVTGYGILTSLALMGIPAVQPWLVPESVVMLLMAGTGLSNVALWIICVLDAAERYGAERTNWTLVAVVLTNLLGSLVYWGWRWTTGQSAAER